MRGQAMMPTIQQFGFTVSPPESVLYPLYASLLPPKLPLYIISRYSPCLTILFPLSIQRIVLEAAVRTLSTRRRHHPNPAAAHNVAATTLAQLQLLFPPPQNILFPSHQTSDEEEQIPHYVDGNIWLRWRQCPHSTTYASLPARSSSEAAECRTLCAILSAGI